MSSVPRSLEDAMALFASVGGPEWFESLRLGALVVIVGILFFALVLVVATWSRER